MFAVQRIGSWVYTVAGPFHPFGGAVDIIVVEQPDGSFKSSPWYVRFGKFQGVLKTREKVVTINVNGVDATFNMYLDGRGAAYFLREGEGSEGESLSSPLSLSHGRDSPRSPMKSKSFNYDGSTSNLSVQNDSITVKAVPRSNSQLVEGSNGKVIAQSNSQRSRIMGLVFGRRSIKEGSHQEEVDDDAAGRTSLDRAQIAADLMEVQWSTSLATSGKPNASQSTDSGKSDVEGDNAVGANAESNQVKSYLHDISETCVDHHLTVNEGSSSSNVAIGNCSESGTDSLEFSVPEACENVPGVSGQVVETSSKDGISFEDKDGLPSATSTVIEDAALLNNYFECKAEGVTHEIPTNDSQNPDVLKASSVENHDEHSTSDERDASSSGVEGKESGFEKVQYTINMETPEISLVEVKDSNEQAPEAVCLDCGEHGEVCPPSEKLDTIEELLPQETSIDRDCTLTVERSFSNTDAGNDSPSGIVSGEFAVREDCMSVPGVDTSEKVVKISRIDDIVCDEDGWNSKISTVVAEPTSTIPNFDGKVEGFVQEIITHDSPIPDVLSAGSVGNPDENSTSNEREAGIQGEGNGSGKVQSIGYVETAETSIMKVNDSSKQAQQPENLDGGGHSEACPPTEKLSETDVTTHDSPIPDMLSVGSVENPDENLTSNEREAPSFGIQGEGNGSGKVQSIGYAEAAETSIMNVDDSSKQAQEPGYPDGGGHAPTEKLRATDITTQDSPIPDMLTAGSVENSVEKSTSNEREAPSFGIQEEGNGSGKVQSIGYVETAETSIMNVNDSSKQAQEPGYPDGNSTSNEREAPSFGIQGEENGSGKVQSIGYVETAETSIMNVNDSSKQDQEPGYLDGGGHSEACPPTEKLGTTDITTHDSPIPDMLSVSSVENPDENSTSNEREAPSFGIQGEGNGSGKVQSIGFAETAETSIINVNDSSKQAHEAGHLDGGGHSEACPPSEKLEATDELLPQVSSVDSAEVVDSKSISTRSSTCTSSSQIQNEKSADEISTKELEASFDLSCDSEQDVHGSGEASSVPASESSEEDQFLFSDLDEGKIDMVQDKSNVPAPEGTQEVNGSFDASAESCSSHKMLVGEQHQLPDVVNLIGNAKKKSSSIAVPKARKGAGVEWLAQSLPSTWDHPDRLDTGGFRHTLSHSVDSNCSLEWSLSCKEALFRGSLESENQLVQHISDEEDTQNSNLKCDVTNPTAGDPSKAQTTSGGSWGLWPFSFRRSTSEVTQPPSVDTTVQPPSNDTAVQPPSNDTAVQSPLIDMKPPSHDNTVQPPLNDTSVQPPPNDTTMQPPFKDTTIQQIQNDTIMLPTDTALQPTVNDARISGADNVTEGKVDMSGNKNLLELKVRKNFVRALSPTSEQLASLNLKEGKNVVTFTFSTAMLGKQQVDARIYRWKWNSRIVISDVDGTITKSDVLGQFMPLVGVDWSQTGVTHLFSAIKENGYQLLFLSARSISQAHLTRQFLFNLKQDGKPLPDGPVVISPDGLFPSLFREVIRRAPHEFKISCLEDIKALFPADCHPFYAGFGNRDTDEISYMKVGIPKGKIFTINPKGQVAVNRRVDTRSYTSLHTLVHGMFPPCTASLEQEDFNSWNFWRLPPADI